MGVAEPSLACLVGLPLLGALGIGLGGSRLQRRIGASGLGAIASAPIAVATALTVRALAQLMANAPDARILDVRVGTWLAVGDLQVDATLVFDPLSALMALLVTGIGALVCVYSAGSMRDEPGLWRYFALLNLFIGAMLLLVLAGDLLVLFVAWEGVAFCSYALIGFWYRDAANANAGAKAFIVNRVGDVGLLLGISLLFWAMHAAGKPTTDIGELARHSDVLAGATLFGWSVPALATLLLFVGAAAKSAQFPLHVWLPDAMAGPTPASALIHAATMVTAGVYLIARLDFLFVLAPSTQALIAWVGAVTAFLAATAAACQDDIKKALSYSTVSQLGLMMLALGVAAPSAALFHLTTHGVIKAALFLGAGSILHAMRNDRDLRHMGGLRRWLPWTHGAFVVAAAALAGIPPFSGFFSKDEILWRALAADAGGPLLWFVALLTSALTSFYAFRLVILAFHGDNRSEAHVREGLHESPRAMLVPLSVLAALAVSLGFLGLPDVFGGTDRLGTWLSPTFAALVPETAAPTSVAARYLLAVTTAAVAFGGLTLAHAMYISHRVSSDAIARIAGGVPLRWIQAGYGFDALYRAVFHRGVRQLARASAALDRGGIDAGVRALGASVRGIASATAAFDRLAIDRTIDRSGGAVLRIGGWIRALQTGSIHVYLYIAVIAVAAAIVLHLIGPR